MSGKYALIIANTEYTDTGLAQLSAPGKDAEDFARVLQNQEICGFSDVKVLLNEQEHVVRVAIDEFLDQKKPDDLLVLYFSGHGVRDEAGALYLAVKNTNRFRLRSTAVKSDYIRDAMEHSRSKRQVLILDCCNSGAFAQGAKTAMGTSIGTATAFNGGYGNIILTASDAIQFAWEGDQVIGEQTDNSLFTHYLVEGLEGEADLDGDGRVSVDELYDYAYEKVKFATPQQTPSKFSSKQQGEIILRDNIKIENTKPIPLSDELITAMGSSSPYIREGAVGQLEMLLKGKNLHLARSARAALERIAAEDDSRRVVQVATKVLESYRQGDSSSSLSRTAQLRRENFQKTALFKQEQEKLLQEKAELEKRLQEEVSAREKAETQPLRAKVEVQPRKSRSMTIGILGVVIVAVVVFGYILTSLLSTPAPTETPTATQASTEALTTLVVQPPVVIQSPTEEITNPTEAITETVSAPQPEIIDSKGVSMVLVPESDFPMGSSNGNANEKPVHSVHLDAYYIDKFEVTNTLYSACVNAGVCNPPIKSDSFTRSSYYGNIQYGDFPVIYVTWNMAKTYCAWRDVHLPTEAQWEKAARGADARTYPWGKGIDCQKANYHTNNGCYLGTNAVGSYENGKSPYGAYDMAGNVWEWVADWYSEAYYQTSPPSNPLGPDTGRSRIVRGGSWNRGEFEVRAAIRVNYAPDYSNFDIGFRCATETSQ